MAGILLFFMIGVFVLEVAFRKTDYPMVRLLLYSGLVLFLLAKFPEFDVDIPPFCIGFMAGASFWAPLIALKKSLNLE